MMKSKHVAGWLAPLFMLLGTPTASQGATVSQNGQTAATPTWLSEITEALVVGAEALTEIGPQTKATFASMSNPEQARAAAPGLRMLLRGARTKVEQSGEMLVSIQLPPSTLSGYNSLDAQQILTDARAQNARTLKVIQDFDVFLSAVEKNDVAKLRASYPALVRSSFVLLDNQALIYRNRQAALPPTHSAHQALGVAFQIYRMMGETGRAWFAAKFGGDSEVAAIRLRERLLAAASDTVSLTKTGRANLTREIVLMEKLGRSASDGSKEALLAGQTLSILKSGEEIFNIGDELADWARANADVSGEELAKQQQPEMIGELTRFEHQYMRVALEQADLFK